jgi:hypothetical protein
MVRTALKLAAVLAVIAVAYVVLSGDGSPEVEVEGEGVEIES